MPLPTRSQYLSFLATPSIDLSTDWSCPICMGTSQQDVVVAHDEKHIFCRACLTSWLHEASTCPACRQVLFTTSHRPGPGSHALRRRTDSYRLAQIWGYDFYLSALQEEQPSAELVPHFLRETLTRLRERWEMYRSGTLTMDVSYNSLPRRGGNTNDDEEDSDLHTISSTPLITVLFASWWSFFVSRRGQSTLLHHPLVTGLLFAAVSALKDWDGQPRSARSLKTMMGIRLGRGFDALYPFERPEGWDSYRKEFVEVVGRVFEGVYVDKSVLGNFESRALAAVDCHEEVWRQFQF